MRLPLWIAGSLTLLPLSAQSTAALAVRNLVLQQDESIVEFDIVNQSSKAAHAWTMAITAKRNGSPALVEFLLTSESCARDASGPLTATETRHCRASLRSASDVPIVEATPRVTAILFEDGSAEGDLATLDRQTAERAMRVRIRQYFLDRFHEACAPDLPAADQLKKFAAAVRDPAPPPAPLAADAGFVREQRWVEQQVENAIQQTDAHNLDPGTTVRGLGSELERRVKIAEAAAALFPPRKT
jgi:hypothetical protein